MSSNRQRANARQSVRDELEDQLASHTEARLLARYNQPTQVAAAAAPTIQEPSRERACVRESVREYQAGHPFLRPIEIKAALIARYTRLIQEEFEAQPSPVHSPVEPPTVEMQTAMQAPPLSPFALQPYSPPTAYLPVFWQHHPDGTTTQHGGPPSAVSSPMWQTTYTGKTSGSSAW